MTGQVQAHNRAILKHFEPLKRNPEWAGVSPENWSSWIWQQQNRVKTSFQLGNLLSLSTEEKAAFDKVAPLFRMAVTPYYLSLMSRTDPSCPIRRQGVPQETEAVFLPTELKDPSKEDTMSPAPGVVHRYPDRVLLYTTHNCAVYCRFCTRKRKVADPDSALGTDELDQGIAYIRSQPQIREVVVSGGDALSNSDDRLAQILEKLRSIDHIEIIRLGSRNLVTLPYRVTPDFAKMVASFSPVFFHTHFNHPKECTLEALEACNLLSSAGIPLNNHTVLLKGINDDAEVMRALNLKLLMMKVRPYYLYQCDRVFGNSGFRTSVETGLDIIHKLRGWSSGLAVPHYVMDTPGGGKVPLLPNYVVDKSPGRLLLKNYQGKIFEFLE